MVAMKKILFIIGICILAFFACKKDINLLHEEAQDATDKKIVIENGAIKAEFSVSDTKKVYFSQGNLQYNASTNTWRFAENQYDRVGLENSKISSTYSGWIDLFGWGMSGYNDKYPYLATENRTDYVDDRNSIARTNYDWGIYNKISNGGNATGLWRTLTKDEWDYLIYKRYKGTSEAGIGWAKVNGFNGLILLPDDWILPQGLTFVEGGYYSDTLYNIYSITDWKKMESHGAVFLPAAGERYGATVTGVKNTGRYWSSIGYSGGGAYCLGLHVHYGDCGCTRYAGLSVRLVQDVGGAMENIELPTVFTGIVYSVSYGNATVSGSVSSDGGTDIIERGICWSTNSNPTITDDKLTDGNDIGSYSIVLSELTEGTTYYVRAYATNSEGTAYGEVISFTTKKNVSLPIVKTDNIFSILYTTATIDGNVSSDGGADVTERGICWSTTPNPTISNNKQSSGSGTGAFSVSLSNLSEGTTYYVRAYATNSEGTAYGEVISFKTKENTIEVVDGAIQAAFSVSATKKVYFSRGNLQYQASTNTWRFAEHQYDMIGEANSNISSTYSGWIDLFGWGTSGYNGKNPYMTSTDASDYGYSYSDIAGTNYDWGVYNKISNGGNQAGLWRTLTYSEWNYLTSGRSQASCLMGQGRVNDVNGLILLPDGWKTPSSVIFTCAPDNYSTNEYSLDEWAVMQSYGAVFLPTTGRRSGTTVIGVFSHGKYWSSSAYNYYIYPYCLYFYSNYVYTGWEFESSSGESVRLVKDIN